MKESLNELLFKLYHEIKNLDIALKRYPIQDRSRILLLKIQLSELESGLYEVTSDTQIKSVLEAFYLRIIEFKVSEEMLVCKKDLFNMVYFIDRSLFAAEVYHALYHELPGIVCPLKETNKIVKELFLNVADLKVGRAVMINGITHNLLTPFLDGADFWMAVNEDQQPASLVRIQDFLPLSKESIRFPVKNQTNRIIYPIHLN